MAGPRTPAQVEWMRIASTEPGETAFRNGSASCVKRAKQLGCSPLDFEPPKMLRGCPARARRPAARRLIAPRLRPFLLDELVDSFGDSASSLFVRARRRAPPPFSAVLRGAPYLSELSDRGGFRQILLRFVLLAAVVAHLLGLRIRSLGDFNPSL